MKYVNRLLNSQFGTTARNVPAHSPHFIDKHIMQELQDTWPKEYNETSSHYFRSPRDMQMAFSYYYFLMHQTVPFDYDEAWESMDVNQDEYDRANILTLVS